MKLNLGSGSDRPAGWVNVDKYRAAAPDIVHDLESIPWPLPDGCAEEVLLKHVLEHLGRDTNTLLGIIQELYRVCAPGATVRILVPHPRHQDFLQDPTHVRPILPEMFQHFSLAANREWERLGLPGTPLARYLGVDFETVSTTLTLDPRWNAEFRSGRISREDLDRAMQERNNVVQVVEVVLRAVKPAAGTPAPGDGRVPSVRWEGTQFACHSLAHVNRQVCSRLLASGGVELTLQPFEADQFDPAAAGFGPLAACVRRPIPPAQVHVRHLWPPSFVPPAEGAWVMIQPWEYGGIPLEWVAPMRDRVDEVWVPSPWLRDCYIASGVPADQVAVVPNGVDATVFTPEGPRFPLATRKGFKFLFVGGTIPRKGIDLALQAFVSTFRATDDVCLVIKGQAGGVYLGSDLGSTLEAIRKDPMAPEIEYLVDNLDEPTLASLYRACDVLAAPYRGEGFSLPIAEAMASGLAVVATGRGGASEFLREDWAWVLPSRTARLRELEGMVPSQAGFWVEEPDPDALVAALKEAAARPDLVREKGLKGRAFVQERLTWDLAAAKALERIQILAQRRPRRESALAAPDARKGVAFRFQVDWREPAWIGLVLAYVQAFSSGEPVGLVLPWDAQASGVDLAAAQAMVVEVCSKAGWKTIPPVVMVDKPSEMDASVAPYAQVVPLPADPRAIRELPGPYGTRLVQALGRLYAGL
jgi:glycosyltransferase involved in cell wall biosynthesis